MNMNMTVHSRAPGAFPSLNGGTASESSAGAGKARAGEGAVSIASLLSALKAGGETGRSLASALAGKPDLAAPKAGLQPQDVGVLRAWLSDKLNDAQFTGGLEQTIDKMESILNEELAKLGDANPDAGFDISGLSTRMAALLAQAIVLMSALRTNDSALSGKLSIVSIQSAEATAASIVREGMNHLLSSVSQSMVQVAVSAASMAKQGKGLSQEKMALKGHAERMRPLNNEASFMEKNKGQLSHSMKSAIQAEENRFKLDMNGVQSKQMSGKAMGEIGGSLAGISGGAGKYAASLEQSQQQVSQASGRVASNAADEARDRSRKADGIIQDLLRALDSITQSKSGAISTIAGNLRA
ncbi:hypothetical protein DK843_03040 [Chromobacterium phragmitis]|uniref:Effector protein BipC n=2 Tax=Chromobacterium phragmitis TaxID=2202141 RepID=A0A344UDM8_9NEIS|nr:hypothetical protein DK843_03040 [Chromobacterium phragmitis]